MSHIGGLNGRYPFFCYLKREAEKALRVGKSLDDIVRMIKIESLFWSKLLRAEMSKYDAMRLAGSGLKRNYAFVHFEFDDLFRYYQNPVECFTINIQNELSAQQRDKLVKRFAQAIKAKCQIPWSVLPLSFLQFLWKFYQVLFVNLFKFTHYIIRDAVIRKRPDSIETAKAMTFWKKALFWGILLNIALGFGFYRIILTTVDSVITIVFLVLLQLFLIPISLRTVIQLFRTIMAFRYSSKTKVAPIKSWRQLFKYFPFVWGNADQYHKENYELMLQDMCKGHQITELEFERFKRHKLLPMPANKMARYRIRRWMNKYYHLQAIEVNQLFNWDEMKSLTILVFSLDEKFFYSLDELISDRQNGELMVISILEQLRRSYSDEWGNFVDRLQPKLSTAQIELLRRGNWQFGNFAPKIVSVIEHWANMRIQSLYHTLESVRLAQAVYWRIARGTFPQANAEKIKALVKEKLQIILLHDLYPTYTHTDKQKTDIDAYLAKYPEVEIYWPKDLVHHSKYAAFATVLPYIKGDLLLKLDSDHHIDTEEMAYLPYLFRIFDHYPECDAVGFRLYAFNERYNSVTHLASLSSNAWWVHDLRVKDLVGGGGVFGKMLIRTKALIEKEFIQPDSVAEDMLAMSRLSIYGAQLKFSELVEMGQGEDISYYGLKCKLGRYAVGAVESSATKVYREMMISPEVPLYRKLESMFMLSYYPIQSIIALSHFLVLFAWALNIKIVTLFPLSAVLSGYLLITLVDSFYVWVHMHEREGIIRGTKRYVETFFPMMVFHGGYFYHYLEQLLKALQGYARFNISQKKYELISDAWNVHYKRNRFSFNLGSLALGFFLWGALFYSHSRIEFVFMLPFLLSIFVWGFSVLFLIPRKKGFLNIVDFFGEVVLIFFRAYYDMFLNCLRLYRKRPGD